MPAPYRNMMDPYLSLMAAASVTTTLKLGTGIALLMERELISQAKTIGTLDRLSNGRVIIGTGVGWNEEEFSNGRGIFRMVDYRDPAETIDEDYPVWLTTGRRLVSYHTHTQTGRSKGIDYLLPEEVLEVHPDDAASWGLEHGGCAVMTSRRGHVRLKVEATQRSPRGTVFTSFAFPDVAVNNLTGGGYDPITQTAELKVCPVRIEAD